LLYKSYADLKRISKNSRILPDLVTINFIHAGTTERYGKPSDESIKEKYRCHEKSFLNTLLWR